MAGNEKGAGLSQRLYKRKGPTAEAVGPTTHGEHGRFVGGNGAMIACDVISTGSKLLEHAAGRRGAERKV